MVPFRSLVFLAAAGVDVIYAQNQTATNQTSSDPNPGRCEGEADPIDTAAAWGVGGQLPAVNNNSADFYQWLYVESSQGRSVVSLLSKPGVPLPDESSPYDYCMVSFELPLNNLLLAQTDDGSCSQTFGADCVQSMKDAAANVAASQSFVSLPDENQYCIDIADAVSQAFQTNTSCKARNPSNSSMNSAGYYTGKDSFCNNSTSSVLFPGYFVSLLGGYFNYNMAIKPYYNDTYDRSYRTVWPQMLVTVNYTDSTLMPKSYMGCPRITNKLANATVPSPLPAGNAASKVLQSAGSGSLLGSFLVSALVYFL